MTAPQIHRPPAQTRARLARSLAAPVLLLLAAATTGCGLYLGTALTAPESVVASQDQVDLVEVTWASVRGADLYYVYRSLSPDGPFGSEGDYGKVPYRTVIQPTMIDAQVDATSYYYRISASRLVTGEESAMSEVAHGYPAPHEAAWQEPGTISFNPGTIRTTIDRVGSTIRAYVLTVTATAGTTLTVNEIAEDGTLTSLGGPADETIDGRVPRAADVAAGGSPYVAFVAENPVLSADTGKVFLARYNEDAQEWEVIEGPGSDDLDIPKAHQSAPYVTLLAIGEDDVLVTYRDENGQFAGYRYSGTRTAITAPDATDDDADSGGPSIGLIDGAALADATLPGSAVLIYELESDVTATLGDTESLRLSLWDGSDWTAGGTEIYDGSDGNMSVASVTFDPAVSPATDGITAAYIDSGALHLTDAAGADIASAAGAFPGTPDTASPSLAIAAQSNVVMLFYLDQVEVSGRIQPFDSTQSSWLDAGPEDFTDGDDPALFHLAAGGGRWFAVFESAGRARLRVYQ